MLPAVHAGAAQLLAQLGMTYFMPFCLSALSMLARIQVDLLSLLVDTRVTTFLLFRWLVSILVAHLSPRCINMLQIQKLICCVLCAACCLLQHTPSSAALAV